MTDEVAAGLRAPMLGHEIDVGGVGGTLTANALSMAAMRAALATSLRDEDFAVAIPLAERWTDGVAAVDRAACAAVARAAAGLPGRVLVLPAAPQRRRRRRGHRRRAGGASCTCGRSTAGSC